MLGQKPRQSAQHAIDHTFDAAFGYVGKFGERDCKKIQRQRNRLTMKISPFQVDLFFGQDKWVVGHGIYFRADNFTRISYRVTRRAVHLRDTAYGIGILDPWVPESVRFTYLASSQELAQVCSRFLLAAMRTGRLDARIE